MLVCISTARSSRALRGALVATLAALAIPSVAQAHTSPEYFYDGWGVAEQVFGPGHRHTLTEVSARITGGGVICAGALNDDGSSILQDRFCSYDLSVQPLNGSSWRRGIAVQGGATSWVRARETF